MTKKKDMKKLYLFALLVVSFIFADNTNVFGQTDIRVLNINIRLSGQMTGYSVLPFADYIKAYDPDFVTLQEVDFMTIRNGQRDFTTELAAELGYFSAFGYALKYAQGEYGVAILSKYPIEKISNTHLTGDPSQMKEVRTLLYIDVIIPSVKKKVRIGSTHLDHSTDAVRSSMIQQINAATGANVPMILCGDFNAKPDEPAIKQGMSSWNRVCNNFATFPASGPTSKIDYMFAKPDNSWKVKNYEVLVNTADITDHCAIITDIQLTE